MHVLMMTAIGLVLLAATFGGARALGRDGSSRIVARGAGLFAFLWLIACAVDIYVGVSADGVGASVDLAAYAVIFGIPVAAALALARRASRRDPARPDR